MHSRVKYEGGHAEAYFSAISACRTGLRNGGNSGAIGQLRQSLHGDNFSPSPELQGGGRGRREGELARRDAETGRDGVGLRLDSAAGPLGARRGSGDAPFHSQTADIANPFQNISFLNAWSSRWITNLSITSLSRARVSAWRKPRIRHAVSAPIEASGVGGDLEEESHFETDCRLPATPTRLSPDDFTLATCDWIARGSNSRVMEWEFRCYPAKMRWKSIIKSRTTR